MNFENVLAQLPTCPGSTVLPVNFTPGGLRYIQKGLPEFIGPDVLHSSAIEQPDRISIMIISAAGAVGKSTLGNELARRKQAPIWDLAQASTVGGNSLTGQLTTSFGFKLAADVSERITAGEFFLVVDALDEARVKANEAGFEAFIQNIASIARDGRPVRLSFSADTLGGLVLDEALLRRLCFAIATARAEARNYERFY